MRTVPLLFLAAGALGCDDIATFFPPGLEPLEPVNHAPTAAPGSEALVFAEGQARDWQWVHARGYVRASLDETWSAFQDPDVVTDRRAVDEYAYMFDAEMGFDRSFVVHNVVHGVVTVDFDMTWRQSRIEPGVGSVRFQKTFGTIFIDILRGSIVLREVEPGVTSIEAIEHIAAAQGGPETLKRYLDDLHASVVARVNGRPLPVYPD